MADLFHKGDLEYQTDEKWYELVEEEELAQRAHLRAPRPTD